MGGIAPPSPARALHYQGENSRTRTHVVFTGDEFYTCPVLSSSSACAAAGGARRRGRGGKELDWAGLVCRAAGGPGQAGAACGGGGRGGGGGPDSGGPRQHTTALTIIHPHQPCFVFV